ncbi:hypothetical protein EMIT0P201_40583 [Pseudomonas chlororaphis]
MTVRITASAASRGPGLPRKRSGSIRSAASSTNEETRANWRTSLPAKHQTSSPEPYAQTPNADAPVAAAERSEAAIGLGGIPMKRPQTEHLQAIIERRD